MVEIQHGLLLMVQKLVMVEEQVEFQVHLNKQEHLVDLVVEIEEIEIHHLVEVVLVML
jgi:hypothetical protein